MNLKPMLAGKATDDQIRELFKKFGKLEASPKLDGIRCLIQNGIALSRSLKPIRNKHVQSLLGHEEFNGLDGELIVGAPTDSDVYRNTTSHVMSEHKEFKFTFWVFDNFALNMPYADRRDVIHQLCPQQKDFIQILSYDVVTNMGQLQDYESDCLAVGYEGVILRDPNAVYKHGRSTAKEGGLIKVKRFSDSEATILGMEEQLKNNNEKKVNELGRGQRSSHKENKSPKGTLGALICKDATTGVQFNIGTGFSDTVRDQLWKHKDDLIGETVKYKYFDIGVKDAPRHPVYLGIRIPEDMS
tara:strand:+ start:1934 stop:2833 length:900 start_codon:yes stop_codon:yes gene_type:complete